MHRSATAPSGDADALQQACDSVAGGKARAAIVVSTMGEGASAICIKNAHQAVQDGNPIRSVLRKMPSDAVNGLNGDKSRMNGKSSHNTAAEAVENRLHIDRTEEGSGRVAGPLSITKLIKSVFILERGDTVLNPDGTKATINGEFDDTFGRP